MLRLISEVASTPGLIRLAGPSIHLQLFKGFSAHFTQNASIASDVCFSTGRPSSSGSGELLSPSCNRQTGGPVTQRQSRAVDACSASMNPIHYSLESFRPPPFLFQQHRSYKSSKRSMKRLNTAASWRAARPFMPDTKTTGNSKAETEAAPVVDTCILPVPVVPKPAEATGMGVITKGYRLALKMHFAVVEAGGVQYKVTPDDVIFVNKLKGVEVNEVLSLQRVLMLGNVTQTIIGRPYIPGASVLVAVEEHFKDGKVHVYKKTRRNRYRKVQGIVASKSADSQVTVKSQILPIRWYGKPEKRSLIDADDEEDESEEEEEVENYLVGQVLLKEVENYLVGQVLLKVPFTGYLKQLTLQQLANLQVIVGEHQQLDPQAANTLYQKGLTQAQTVIEQSVDSLTPADNRS
eukprot:gene5777-6000_t